VRVSADGAVSEGAAAAGQPLAPEDAARANFYAVLARLFVDAPDAALLSAIAAAAPLGEQGDRDGSGDPESGLPAAWDALREASAAADPQAVVEEYNSLFIGVGKSAINLHASHWIAGAMMDKPLIELRDSLAELGLSRRPGVTLLEDHAAALCETMRILIAGDGERAPAPIEAQRRFFDHHIAPWIFACCSAMQDCSIANYYRQVAKFTDAFMALERDSFAIE
jgi:TorA maturation chaperone TorD